MPNIKKIIKKFLPPILTDIFKKSSKYGYFGDYETWNSALSDSSGYDDSQILEKVKNSLLKVKSGDAVYERDSVLFDKKQYSWPLLAGLLFTAVESSNRLNVLDFGGSLGSSYYQNIDFLKNLNEFKWNVVEQKNFVECGKEHFQDHNLKFYESISDCIKVEKVNVFLASSSIQYIEKPYELLEEILSYGFDYIIFDRTIFLKNKDRITIQKVPPRIYDASYPARFLNEEKFLKIFSNSYNLMSDFESLAGSNINLANDIGFEKGFIFKKK